jgi:predicted RNA-binding Zn ribbon-like protein
MAGTDQHAYTWSRIGGHPALDLCNTVSWRLDATRTIERLTDPATLVDWFCSLTDDADSADSAARARLADDLAAHPRNAAQALQAVRDLREATTRLLDAHLDSAPAEPEDLASVSRAWRAALAVADAPASLPLRPTIDPSTLPLVAACLSLTVADLLREPDLSALRRCDGEACGWLFLDTTRNHSRRWCDALDCGNRARVRAYSRRHRAPAPEGDAARGVVAQASGVS